MSCTTLREHSTRDGASAQQNPAFASDVSAGLRSQRLN
jgi:hypothetical protein